MSYLETSYRSYMRWSEDRWGWDNTIANRPKKEPNMGTKLDLRIYDWVPYCSRRLAKVSVDDLPPFTCHLEDMVVGQLVDLISAGKLTKSNAHKCWPNIFDTEGRVYRARRPMGRPCLVTDSAGNRVCAKISGSRSAVLLCGSGPHMAGNMSLEQSAKSWILKEQGAQPHDILMASNIAASGGDDDDLREDDGGILPPLPPDLLTLSREGWVIPSGIVKSARDWAAPVKLVTYGSPQSSVQLVQYTFSPATLKKQGPRPIGSSTPLPSAVSPRRSSTEVPLLLADNDVETIHVASPDEPLSEEEHAIQTLVGETKVVQTGAARTVAMTAAFARAICNSQHRVFKHLMDGQLIDSEEGQEIVVQADQAVKEQMNAFLKQLRQTATFGLLNSPYDCSQTVLTNASHTHILDGQGLPKGMIPAPVASSERAYYSVPRAMMSSRWYEEAITGHLNRPTPAADAGPSGQPPAHQPDDDLIEEVQSMYSSERLSEELSGEEGDIDERAVKHPSAPQPLPTLQDFYAARSLKTDRSSHSSPAAGHKRKSSDMSVGAIQQQATPNPSAARVTADTTHTNRGSSNDQAASSSSARTTIAVNPTLAATRPRRGVDRKDYTPWDGRRKLGVDQQPVNQQPVNQQPVNQPGGASKKTKTPDVATRPGRKFGK